MAVGVSYWAAGWERREKEGEKEKEEGKERKGKQRMARTERGFACEFIFLEDDKLLRGC